LSPAWRCRLGLMHLIKSLMVLRILLVEFESKAWFGKSKLEEQLWCRHMLNGGNMQFSNNLIMKSSNKILTMALCYRIFKLLKILICQIFFLSFKGVHHSVFLSWIPKLPSPSSQASQFLNMFSRLRAYFNSSRNPKLSPPLLLVSNSTMFPPSFTSSSGFKSLLEQA
jgi:hypothetical protein